MKGLSIQVSYYYKLPQNYQEIIQIEQYDHLDYKIVRDQVKLTLNKEKCIRLADLHYLLNIPCQGKTYQYIQLYRFQVLQVIRMIAEHLYQIKQKGLDHNNLNKQNIWIRFGQTNLHTYYNKELQIEQIYFVNYDTQQKQNYTDFQSIKQVFLEFAKNINIKEIDHEINKIIEDVDNNNESLNQFINLVSSYIDQLKKSAGVYGQEDTKQLIEKIKQNQIINDEGQNKQQKQSWLTWVIFRSDNCGNQNKQDQNIQESNKKVKIQEGQMDYESPPQKQEEQSWGSWLTGYIPKPIKYTFNYLYSCGERRYYYSSHCSNRKINLIQKVWFNNQNISQELFIVLEQHLLDCLYREQFRIFAKMFETNSFSADDKHFKEIELTENGLFPILLKLFSQFQNVFQNLNDFIKQVDQLYKNEFKIELDLELVDISQYYQDLWLQWISNLIGEDLFILFNVNIEDINNQLIKQAKEYYLREHRRQFSIEIEKLVKELQ